MRERQRQQLLMGFHRNGILIDRFLNLFLSSAFSLLRFYHFVCAGLNFKKFALMRFNIYFVDEKTTKKKQNVESQIHKMKMCSFSGHSYLCSLIVVVVFYRCVHCSTEVFSMDAQLWNNLAGNLSK